MMIVRYHRIAPFLSRRVRRITPWRKQIKRLRETTKACVEIRMVGMKKYICLLAGIALLAACEQKETTVTNPPAEKKESSTTIINQSPAPATKEEKTDININTSPAPSP
jgi:hypothetical protein